MKLISFTLAAGAALAAVTGHAADIDEGRQLAYTCTGCHGVERYKNIYPHYNVPKIAGQSKEYIVIALQSYRVGDRAHPTMRAQGESLSDQEIDAIATYLASLGGEPR